MIDDLPLRPLPGEGLLARFDGIVLFCAASADARAASELLDLCADVAAASGHPGRAMARRLAGYLGSSEADQLPFCAIGQADGQVAVVVHGPVVVRGTAGGTDVELRGDESASWVDRLLPGDVAELHAAAIDHEPTEAHPLTELGRGVIVAGGFALSAGPAWFAGSPATTDRTDLTGQLATPAPDPAAAPPGGAGATPDTDAPGSPPNDAAPTRQPSELPPPEPTAEPVAREHVDFESIVLVDAEPDGEPEPLPIGSEPAEEATAPSVGFLVFDDGTTFTLDATYVVGREPHTDAAVASGDARPLRLESRNETVSRVHAEVRLDHDGVLLDDRGSTNGTFVWDDATNTWLTVQPGQPVRLQPGAHGAFGHRTFVYESRPEHTP